MPDRPTYIVTGGAGFIGANLAAALLSRDPRPRILIFDNLRSGSVANIVEACERRKTTFDGEVIPASTADSSWLASLADPDLRAVFHIGAITDTTLADETEMIRENTANFRELLHACAGRSIPLVYASSAGTYGTPPQTRDRIPFPLDAAGRPSNVYGFSKWLMESIHRDFARNWPREKPLRITGLRYFNVFGPGEARKGKMASMVYQLAMQLLSGKRPRLFADGAQARDQIYIDDVVDCSLAAAGLGDTARKDPQPGIYNLGSGVATSFNQVLAALRRALGVSEKDRPTDYFEMPPEIRRFYQDYTCADMSATERALGWKPRWKPEQAIEHYARWLQESPGARPR